MPFAIRKQGGKFVIKRRDTGEVKSHHTSRKKAKEALAAMYANDPKLREGK